MEKILTDERGVFYAGAATQPKLFYRDDETLLTTRTIPDGSWPICYDETERGRFLYFTYFLSGTLHKWQVTETGRRARGLGSKSDDLLPFLRSHMDDPDLRWLAAKISGRGLRMEEFPTAPKNGFAALEHIVAQAIIEGGGREAMEASANAFGVAGEGFSRSDPHFARHFRVPEGYRDAVALSRPGADEIPNVWAHLDPSSASLDSRITPELRALILADATPQLSGAMVRLQLAGAKPLPDHCVEVVFNPLLDAADCGPQHSLTLRIYVPETLLGERTAPSRYDTVSNRLKHSLGALVPHLLRFVDHGKREFTLRFSFSDSGDAGFISFDRPTHSNWPLIPDLYLLFGCKADKFYPCLDPQAFERAFRSKRTKLFWRGATTGSYMSTIDDVRASPRVRACLTIKDQLSDLADCKISRLAQMPPALEKDAAALLGAAGLLGEFVPGDEFGLYQLYIDLPGNTTAWGAFHKYLLGCAVLRPLPLNRELSYYSRLEPGKDFIPVAADLSDLAPAVRRAIANPEEAAAIAYSGRKKIIQYMRDLPETIGAVFEAAAWPDERDCLS